MSGTNICSKCGGHLFLVGSLGPESDGIALGQCHNCFHKQAMSYGLDPSTDIPAFAIIHYGKVEGLRFYKPRKDVKWSEGRDEAYRQLHDITGGQPFTYGDQRWRIHVGQTGHLYLQVYDVGGWDIIPFRFLKLEVEA